MKPSDIKDDFEKKLYNKQAELEMGNTDFARFIGVNRTWVVNFWNSNLPKHPLSKKTMFKLNNRLGISFDEMVEYNSRILEAREKNVG
jgi:hypothetical protein